VEEELLANLGGSFDPPGIHHFWMAVQVLRRGFRQVITPCGIRPEPEKSHLIMTPPHHRAEMVRLTFEILLLGDTVRLDLFDLENEIFTRTCNLQKRYESEGEVWHIVGSDLIQKDQFGLSPIQRYWENGPEIWEQYNFAIFLRPNHPINPGDTPIHSMILGQSLCGSSTEIRRRIAAGESIDDLVMPKVAGYIYEHGLYRPE
jgi:nicotinic acid mononucleotide adenylyltransferase